jgi:hypothetical protein
MPNKLPEPPIIDFPCGCYRRKTEGQNHYMSCSTRKEVNAVFKACSSALRSTATATAQASGADNSDINAIVDPLLNGECFYLPFRCLISSEEKLIEAYRSGGIPEAVKSCQFLSDLPGDMQDVAFYSYFAWRVAIWDQADKITYRDGGWFNLDPHISERRRIAKEILPGLQELRNHSKKGPFFKAPVYQTLSRSGDDAYEHTLQTVITYHGVSGSNSPDFFSQEKRYPYLEGWVKGKGAGRDVPDQEKIMNHIRWMIWLYWRWRLQTGGLISSKDLGSKFTLDDAFGHLEDYLYYAVAEPRY